MFLFLKFDIKNTLEVSGHERLVTTTTVTVARGGPITAKATIENFPEYGDSDEGHVTPRNPRKRSTSEPGIIPNAPPQCKFSVTGANVGFMYQMNKNFSRFDWIFMGTPWR